MIASTRPTQSQLASTQIHAEGFVENLPELTLKIARLFRDARLIKDLHRRRRAQVLPILQRPDDLLIRRDLDDLRALDAFFAFRAAGAGADDRVAVGQALGGLV